MRAFDSLSLIFLPRVPGPYFNILCGHSPTPRAPERLVGLQGQRKVPFHYRLYQRLSAWRAPALMIIQSVPLVVTDWGIDSLWVEHSRCPSCLDLPYGVTCAVPSAVRPAVRLLIHWPKHEALRPKIGTTNRFLRGRGW